MTLPVATYRLQLREGVDFDAAIGFLPHLKDLGISHLYLSPIFTATTGSTHGYDVTDPTRIDPALGGDAGFERLADAAASAGIGLILDLVPNHTAFSVENPWLADVLRHGQGSRFAGHFDIDWDAGPLVLPWLAHPFEALLEQGEVVQRDGCLVIGGLSVPLRPGADHGDLADLHEAQHWRLVHWGRERDGVTHRRFFNVTGLIGMRVEDAAVFDDMHALVFDLLKRGRVQGLRIDHVDGLADPAAYLARLRDRVADVPVWVEKILTGDETLPDWPVQGTTGYEATTMIARLLGNRAGAETLRAAWVAQTGGPERFHDSLLQAKGEVIRRDLAAELRQLMELARQAAEPIPEIDPGDEALREAFMALLTAFPRYRSYFSGTDTPHPDLALMARVAGEAAATLRAPEVVDLLARMITRPQNGLEASVQTRFQQVTGALLAKAHEDTAGFRWTPYLAACEVGADPDHPTDTTGAFERWAAQQPSGGLILTSSHDSKRSEDARMRLVAQSHLPDGALALIDQAATLPEASAVPPNVLWYVVQAVLAIWDVDDPDLDSRLCAHMTKALREADEITSWTHPDEAAEAAVHGLVTALTALWRATPPAPLDRIVTQGRDLSLAQLALKCMLPGVPDIYRGCEGAFLALTDPDNRRPVDLAGLRRVLQAQGLSGRKARLLRALLRLRRDHPGLFAPDAAFRLSGDGIAGLDLSREGPEGKIRVCISLKGQDSGVGTVWPDAGCTGPSPVSVSFLPAAGLKDRTG